MTSAAALENEHAEECACVLQGPAAAPVPPCRSGRGERWPSNEAYASVWRGQEAQQGCLTTWLSCTTAWRALGTSMHAAMSRPTVQSSKAVGCASFARVEQHLSGESGGSASPVGEAALARPDLARTRGGVESNPLCGGFTVLQSRGTTLLSSFPWSCPVSVLDACEGAWSWNHSAGESLSCRACQCCCACFALIVSGLACTCKRGNELPQPGGHRPGGRRCMLSSCARIMLHCPMLCCSVKRVWAGHVCRCSV